MSGLFKILVKSSHIHVSIKTELTLNLTNQSQSLILKCTYDFLLRYMYRITVTVRIDLCWQHWVKYDTAIRNPTYDFLLVNTVKSVLRDHSAKRPPSDLGPLRYVLNSVL